MRSATLTTLIIAALFAAQSWALDITGRVLEDHSGEPLASARVRIVRPGQRLLAADRDTDRDGRFSVQGLPEGDYRLEISKSNHASVTLAAPQSGLATVRLVKLGVISGRVVDGQGRPVAGAVVFPRVEGGDDLMPDARAGATTNANGDYRIHGLLPGRYSIVVSLAQLQSSGAGAMLYPEYLSVSGGDEHRGIDLQFPATSFHAVRGRVQLPDEGGAFGATLVPVDQPDLTVATTTTEEGGTFRFERVPTGSYRLLISGPVRGYGGRSVLLGDNRRYGSLQVDVLGQDVNNLSVSLSPGRSVRLQLAAEGELPPGACPAEAPVRLVPLEDRAARLFENTRLNFNDARTVDGLAPGSYRLALTDLGDRCFLAENPLLDLNDENPEGVIKVLVASSGAIDGRLIGATNARHAVVLAPASVAPTRMAPDAETSGVRIAFTDQQSRFRFPALPPGKYRIAAQPAGDLTARLIPEDLSKMFEVDVVGGSPTEVELPASPRQ